MAMAGEACRFCGAREPTAFCQLAGLDPGADRSAVSISQYSDRQIIFREGNPSLAVFCVRAGIVKLSKTSATGEPLIIRLLGPGRLIGYRPLLGGEPFAASAEAVGAVELCAIPAPCFRRLLEASPTLALRLLALMARELRISEEQALILAHESVRARTVRQLLGFLSDTGVSLESGAPVVVPLLRRELAQMVGTSPETLSRTLHRLAQDGALRLTRTAIWVQNPRRLRAILGERD